MSCNEPFLFYRCSSNGFAGCCTVDPCALPWCPNFPEPANKPSVYPTVSISTTVTSKFQASASTSLTQGDSRSSDTTISSDQTVAVTTISTPTATSPPSVAAVSSSPDGVTVWATSNSYVTSEARTPSSHGAALSPTTLSVTRMGLTSVFVSVRTHTHYPTTTVTLADMNNSTSSSEPQAQASGGLSQRDTTIAIAIGSALGVAVAACLIWGVIRRKRQRKVARLTAGELGDSRNKQRDARKRGDQNSKDEGMYVLLKDSHLNATAAKRVHPQTERVR